MLRVLTLTLMLCGVSMLRAQDRPYPFGEIPKADLMMTAYDRDSLAPALVLVNYGLAATSDNDQQYILLTTRHRRLKILKPAGLEYANVTIPYYHADDTEFVHAIKAQTITPDGRKYPISQKDIFREKVNDRWSQVKFALPNGGGSFLVQVMKQDSGLSLSYSLDIKKDLYLPEEYEALRALFVKLAASLEEPVVLRRKG